MRTAARYFYSLLVLCVLPAAFGQTAPDSEVDHYIQAEMQKRHIPGLALLVAHNGETVRAQGYGFANLELQVPVKPESIFQSGSMGKQFTATAVMMLVEQDKVRLDDALIKYFPGAPSSWNQVTVRELLSHTGGFTDYPDKFDFRCDYTEDQLLKIVEGIPLAYPPGTKWAYSNLGYLTLGILIHRVSGEFYGDYLQEHIFRPLGMTTTRVISESDIIPNRSSGYLWVKGEWKNQTWVSPTLNTTADGALYFSVLDLAKWDAALYTEKALKRSSLDQMWAVAKLKDGQPNSGHYGFGWFVDTVQGRRVIEHEGQWQGFNTDISRYVDDKLTVVVLTNLDHCAPDEIAHGVAAMYLAKGTSPGD
jgi:CubicO group peptidase (beta-lactamase class C family)